MNDSKTYSTPESWEQRSKALIAEAVAKALVDEQPAKTVAPDGTIVYRSYDDYCMD